MKNEMKTPDVAGSSNEMKGSIKMPPIEMHNAERITQEIDEFKEEQVKLFKQIEKTRKGLMDTKLFDLWVETKNHTLRQQIERLATSIQKWKATKEPLQ